MFGVFPRRNVDGNELTDNLPPRFAVQSVEKRGSHKLNSSKIIYLYRHMLLQKTSNEVQLVSENNASTLVKVNNSSYIFDEVTFIYRKGMS